MKGQGQISATISTATKEKLDRFTRRHGFKKNFVIEQALLLFMEARQELPDEAFLPSRIVVSEASFDRLVEFLQKPPQPTGELKELMRGKEH